MLDDGTLVGVLAFSDLLAARRDHNALPAGILARDPLVARPDETLRGVADLMVSRGHGVLPVVDSIDSNQLIGLVSQFDLLRAHERLLVEERHRERPLNPLKLATGDGALLASREHRR